MTTHSRTVTSFRAAAVPRDTWLRRFLQRLGVEFRALQDDLFSALYYWHLGQGKIVLAGQLDDRESAIERRFSARMQACGCACCRVNLADWREAELFDSREKSEGYLAAADDYDEGAKYARGGSARVEAGRLAVLHAARWGKGDPAA